MDRGGLWHVNDMAYYLFYAIEEEVRCHLVLDLASKLSEGSKDIITSAVMDSEDVLFQWSLSGADRELLQLIVKLYITIRGFSFANSCIELFKKAKKRTLQKGKGLCKEIFTSSVTEH